MLSIKNGVTTLARACSSSLAAPSTLARLRAPTLAVAAASSASPFAFAARSYAMEAGASQAPSAVNEALARTQQIYKTYKPITPGIRHLRRPLTPHLYTGRPLRALTIPLRKNGGRNHHGKITIRSRGGGHKRRIRLVDFVRNVPGPHDVVRVEYDPGRSAHIALLRNRDPAVTEGAKKWSYILAPEGVRAGQIVESFRNGIPDGMVPGYTDSKAMRGKALDGSAPSGTETSADVAARVMQRSSASLAVGVLRAMTVKPGNVLPMRLIPTGTIIHNIALKPDGPGILVRGAGCFGQVVAHDDAGRYTQVRLQSGEVRLVLQDSCATIGKVSNPLWKNRNLGKAGRSRWLGRRPHVRGMAMNA